ncbi:MAG TPA: MBL fold metallo-hydrolase [Gemmatimonadaceae bacterium]|nr:MBL fold metallo-hydrolase [Gemmatimonadaceae bacterium]
MNRRSLFRVLGALLLLAPAVTAQSPLPPIVHDLGRGLYLFQTAPYSDVGLDGNSVAVVGRNGVLVFDANGTPAAAESVLVAIRRLTPLPVRWLVLSHWHWDHWYGAEVYARAFPGLEIIAHERTKALMAGPAVAFNQPGLDAQLPGHLAAVEARLAQLRQAQDTAAGRVARHLEADRFFLSQKRAVRHTLPTRTLADSLTLDLGGRRVVVRHVDRAITPGDVLLHLPDERVVVTGDLLINPVTFALFCYPSGWMRSLDAIVALRPALIVPGHGEALRDDALLRQTRALLGREYEVARGLAQRGIPVAAARDSVLADGEVQRLRDLVTGGDASRRESFGVYLVDWYVRRVYDELAGRLDDSIPRIP